MNILSNIFKYVQLAMAAVVVTENTIATDTGANKQKLAVDLINNEAQVVQIAAPGIAPLVPSFVNMAVSAFNIIGLFQHHKTSAAKV